MEESEMERMQVKCNYDSGMMHIQVLCNTKSELGNRKYGHTDRIPCEDKVSKYLRTQDPEFESAANTGKNYVGMSALVYPEHTIGGQPSVQLLIHGSEHNHPQGMVCSVAMSKKDIIDLVKYLRSVNMLVEQQGLPITREDEE